MYTKEQTKEGLLAAYANTERSSQIMRKFSCLANGLHSDEVKASDDYKDAKAFVDSAFANVRAFNQYAKRKFPIEWKEGYFCN